MTAKASELPLGLEAQHMRVKHGFLWFRRGLLVILVGLCVAALANVFGQRQTTTTLSSGAATLTVDTPQRLRSGLIFTSRYTVVPRRKLQDMRLVLAPDWWRGMTLNAEAPQPSSEDSNSTGVILDYGQIDAGDTMNVWISWQTNPTTYGARDETVYLYDGTTQLIRMPLNLVIFP
jgi:hypothetical protein